jgi:hypothetical protein
MKDDQWYTAVALALILVVAGGMFAGFELGGNSASPRAPAPAAPSTAPDFLYFTVTTSAATDYDTYYPANVSVPHGQMIVVTITSYDPGVNPVPAPYADVLGTVGGIANYTLGDNETPVALTTLPNSELSHTFSVTYPGAAGQQLLGAGQPLINVPVPVSRDGIHPATVTFTITFPGPAQYVWRCVAPCDAYSMATPGFMIGSIDVT